MLDKPTDQKSKEPDVNIGYQLADVFIYTESASITQKNIKVVLQGKSYELLLALVKAAPKMLSHAEIKQQVWNDRVVNDETIKQNIRRIRVALNEDSKQPQYITSIRGKGYCCASEVKGITEKANREEKPFIGKKYASLVGITVLSVCLGWFFFFSKTNETSYKTTRIAVLPFITLNQDNSDNYLANGLTEELISTLSQSNKLRVLARTSVMRFKNTTLGIDEIAKELEVEALIEGSIRRMDDRVKVYVQFIDGETQEHHWSMEFDRPYNEIFSIRKLVSDRIANTLNAKLPDTTFKVPTKNIEAYDDYLKGIENYAKHTDTNNNNAIIFFKRALERDPEFVMARAWLANAYALNSKHQLEDEFSKLSLETAREALKQAPDSLMAFKALSIAYYNLGRFAESIQAANKTLQLKPGFNQSIYNLGEFYLYKGDFALAATFLVKHLTSDAALSSPMHTTIAYARYARIMASMDFVEVAKQAIDRATELEPSHSEIMLVKNALLVKQGKKREALLEAAQFVKNNQNCIDCLIVAANNNYWNGNTERALELLSIASNLSEGSNTRAIFRTIQILAEQRDLKNDLSMQQQLIDVKNIELEFINQGHEDWYHFLTLGSIAVLQEDNEKALEWYIKSIERGFNSLDWFQTELTLGKFRKTSQYANIVEKISKRRNRIKMEIIENGTNLLPSQ